MLQPSWNLKLQIPIFLLECVNHFHIEARFSKPSFVILEFSELRGFIQPIQFNFHECVKGQIQKQGQGTQKLPGQVF